MRSFILIIIAGILVGCGSSNSAPVETPVAVEEEKETEEIPQEEMREREVIVARLNASIEQMQTMWERSNKHDLAGYTRTLEALQRIRDAAADTSVSTEEVSRIYKEELGKLSQQ